MHSARTMFIANFAEKESVSEDEIVQVAPGKL
jgi:hypothetical protein